MSNVNSMKGKKAIVTGGGTGLGAATAMGDVLGPFRREIGAGELGDVEQDPAPGRDVAVRQIQRIDAIDEPMPVTPAMDDTFTTVALPPALSRCGRAARTIW